MTIHNETPAENDTSTSEILEAPTSTSALTRPRIRFGTIVWGLLIMAAGISLLTALGTPGRREELADWVLTMTAGQAMLTASMILGAILLIVGLLAVIRSQQKKRSPEAPAEAAPSEHQPIG